MRPYIGLAGISSVEEFHAVEALADLLPPSHVLVVGVLATPTTVAGGPGKPRYPRRDVWPHLVSSQPNVQTLLHYCVRDNGDPVGQAGPAWASLPPSFAGVQWNLPLAALTQLEHLEHLDALEFFSGRRVVLQVRTGTQPRPFRDLTRVLEPYVDGGVVTDLLLDSSAGLGVGMSVSYTSDLVGYLTEAFGGRVGVGVAGGIRPSNVFDLVPVVAAVSDGAVLSLDVESGLRDAADCFDAEAARRVVEQAARLFA